MIPIELLLHLLKTFFSMRYPEMSPRQIHAKGQPNTKHTEVGRVAGIINVMTVSTQLFLFAIFFFAEFL